MDIKQALEIVVNGHHLTAEQMRDRMRQIMTGKAEDAQIGAFLVALRIKGESIDEIAAAVAVMRELVTGVDIVADHLVDIVGTVAMSQICLTSPRRPVSWLQLRVAMLQSTATAL